MASLSDILTTAQNIPRAINALATTYLNVQGQKNTATITAATVVSSTSGRVCQCVITVAGSAVGSIYDTTDATTPTRKIFTIPMTVGSFVVNMPTAYGIVVVPGTGQTVTVSWS